MSLKGKRSTWSVLVVALSMVLAFAGLAAAYTPAGTQISNIATATYKVGTQERVSSSNIVYVTVEQIHGVEVGPNDAQNRTVVAGQVVQQVFTVENTGNAPDTFNLTAVLEGTHDNVSVAWFHDVNENGVINSGEPNVTTTGISLSAGQKVSIIGQFTIPATADENDSVVLELKAQSAKASETPIPPGVLEGASKPITFKVVENDVVTASLQRDVAEVDPDGTISYTLTIVNQGHNTISTTTISIDPIADTTLVDGITVQGVHEPSWGLGDAVVNNLAPGQSAVITYQLKVDKDYPAGSIVATASVKAGAADAVIAGPATTLVRQIPKVSLTEDAGGTYSIDPTEAGKPYTFRYTVKNEGNGPDSFVISTKWDSSAAPNWPVQLYQGDGVTPLSQQNGEYIVGPLDADEDVEIVVKVTVPTTADVTLTNLELVTTATSVRDSSKSADKTATFDDIQGPKVELQIIGGPTFDGNPGETVEVTVTVKNEGPVPDTFDLDFDDTDLPDGAIVEFFDEGGNPISQVGPVDAGDSQNIKVRITIPDGEEQGSFDVPVTATSQNNKDVESDPVNIEVTVKRYINFTVAPPRVGNVGQGSFVEYEFTITNSGNETETFALNIVGIERLTYQILGTTEGNVVGTGLGNQTIEIDAGESAIVKVRADVDHTVPVGWTETVYLQATAGTAPEDVSRSASLQMTVIGSELSMVKSAAAATPIPGEEIEYTIVVQNVSTEPLTQVIIYDAIPEHTVYVDQDFNNSGTAGATLEYSTVGGGDNSGNWIIWDQTPPTKLSDVTNVRWVLDAPMLVNDVVTIKLTVEIK